MKNFPVILLAGLFICGTLVAEERNEMPDYLNTSLSFEARAEDLVNRMTLEEKISQLGNDSPAVKRLGIPEYKWWNECLHGVARTGFATVFPQAIGMGASFDRDMMYKVACTISDEARAKYHEAMRNKQYGKIGLTYWSPNINIVRDPRWGRGQETYGEDPYLTGQIGTQFVRGLQGNDPKYLKVVATAKHYAVHNGPEPARHEMNVIVNDRNLWETYLPAFKDLVVDAGVYSVMGAYNRINCESGSASWMLLKGILRDLWGFDGYVVSDCGAIFDIYANHKIVKTAPEAAAVGVGKGCDLNCGGVYQEHLLKAVRQGLITEERVDVAVERLMEARMKLGMFAPDKEVPYTDIPYSEVDSPENDRLALEMSRKSLVLLKNDNLLPLDKEGINKIAVIGPTADSVEALCGNYTGTPSHPVTMLKGIQKAAGDKAEVLYSPGCPLTEGFEIDDYKIVDSEYLFTTNEKGEKVNGLRGRYFRNRNMEGSPAVERIDSAINMKWNFDSPADNMENTDFSVVWTGKLTAPVSGKYKLGLASDDGCRLFIDGEKIVEDWTTHAKRSFVSEVHLEAGKSYDIRIEYFQASGEAEVDLVWRTPEIEDAGDNLFDRAVEYTRRSDVAIFVGGITAELEGEEKPQNHTFDGFHRGDRTDLQLPETQRKLIKAMHKTGTKVVLVLTTGSAMAVNWEEENLPAILLAWYPGQRGGDAVADVLFGDYNPAGRLPVTFYKSVDDLADFADYNMRTGKGKTYRYFEGEPLYPFGYGLSFTDFEYSDIEIAGKKLDKNQSFTVSCKVKNTGSRDGEEVVQLYVRNVESYLPMPVKDLRGFERISLKKGQEKTISFELTPAEDMTYYDVHKNDYAVEPGEFEIQIGASSSDIRLKETVVVE